jgi:hypothetical protein
LQGARFQQVPPSSYNTTASELGNNNMSNSANPGRIDPGDVDSLYLGVSEAISSSYTQDGEANALKDQTTPKEQALPSQAPDPAKNSDENEDGATESTAII